nr:MAG TPA: hypothetical protein [Bacteriophage sp.]
MYNLTTLLSCKMFHFQEFCTAQNGLKCSS